MHSMAHYSKLSTLSLSSLHTRTHTLSLIHWAQMIMTWTFYFPYTHKQHWCDLLQSFTFNVNFGCWLVGWLAQFEHECSRDMNARHKYNICMPYFHWIWYVLCEFVWFCFVDNKTMYSTNTTLHTWILSFKYNIWQMVVCNYRNKFTINEGVRRIVYVRVYLFLYYFFKFL